MFAITREILLKRLLHSTEIFVPRALQMPPSGDMERLSERERGRLTRHPNLGAAQQPVVAVGEPVETRAC